jgi:hypothetical protein
MVSGKLSRLLYPKSYNNFWRSTGSPHIYKTFEILSTHPPHILDLFNVSLHLSTYIHMVLVLVLPLYLALVIISPPHLTLLIPHPTKLWFLDPFVLGSGSFTPSCKALFLISLPH